MKNICVFDVNETLLDLKVMNDEFKRVFGDAKVGQVWFGQLIQSSLVSIVTNIYSNFGKIGAAALDMVTEQQSITLYSVDKIAILSKIKNLPPHPEVPRSLARLKKAGYTLVSLTNSTNEIVEAQLKNAKLSKYFDRMFSADTVRRLKPAPEPYKMVADHFGIKMSNLRLIAAHSWDIAGALRVGYKAAFVARPGKVLDPLVERPDIVGTNLREIVDQILTKENL
ncbi:haloacid dehalogenase type II [Candidatus Gottesmanbacteria bacterium]|nr:haloacid dehalogenase type II [Candidatus Gottesmanbacteria bacterium]